MRTAILCAGIVLAGCGGGGGGYDGGGGGSGGGSILYTVGGTVLGLTGTVVLQNNGTDNLSISANGSFAFGGRLGMGANYNVIVVNQPMGHICTVANGSGSIGDAYTAANVTDVMVTCI